MKHGMSHTRLYHIWIGMRRRCENPSCVAFAAYGAKGITVAPEWRRFENFASWSLVNGYAENLTIDRCNNSKGYSPENCRWATRAEQSRNRGIVNQCKFRTSISMPSCIWERATVLCSELQMSISELADYLIQKEHSRRLQKAA